MKPTTKDKSGYNKFSNENNFNLLNNDRRTKNARQQKVDMLWRIKKRSESFLADFLKKGGSKFAWGKTQVNLKASMTSGSHGAHGPFFNSHLEAAQTALRAVEVAVKQTETFIAERTDAISSLHGPSPSTKPFLAVLKGPPGADFDANPDLFWLENADKRSSAPCYDIHTRRLHEEALGRAEEWLRELTVWETDFQALFNRCSSDTTTATTTAIGSHQLEPARGHGSSSVDDVFEDEGESSSLPLRSPPLAALPLSVEEPIELEERGQGGIIVAASTAEVVKVGDEVEVRDDLDEEWEVGTVVTVDETTGRTMVQIEVSNKWSTKK